MKDQSSPERWFWIIVIAITAAWITIGYVGVALSARRAVPPLRHSRLARNLRAPIT